MWARVEGTEIKEIISKPKAMTIGTIQYPANIFNLWTEAELKSLRLYPVIIDNSNLKEKEYYTNGAETFTVTSTEEDGLKVTKSFRTATAKSLTELKSTHKNRINTEAYSLLQDSDWMVVRQAEEGGAWMPQAWATWRAAVRTKANEMCTKVDAVNTVEALAALYVYDTDDVRPLGEFPNKPS